MAKNISEWESIYTEYLTDVNLCLNLFNELERNRTWGDWLAGDRSKIDSEGLLKDTNEFKNTLEILISICTTLSSNIELGRKMEVGYQERSKSNLHLDYFEDESIARQVKDLSIPTSTHEVDYSLCKEHTCYSKTADYVFKGVTVGGSVAGGVVAGLTSTGVLSPIGVDLAICALSASAFNSIKLDSKRGVGYQGLKVLYDSLINTELLSNLQTHCVIMQQLSDNVDMQIETYKLHFGTSDISAEYHETSQQENSPENPEFDTVLDSEHDHHIDNTEPDNSSSPKGTEVIVEQLCVTQQADCTQSSAPDIDEDYLARAKDEYNAVLIAELDELDSTEKGLSEETRIGMATRGAVRSCKRFLKEELKFSNSIADEYIKTIQASSL